MSDYELTEDEAQATPAAPPAPEREAAVEALAHVVYAVERGLLDDKACRWRAGQYLSALDRGTIPDYSRTGASVGAGEVERLLSPILLRFIPPVQAAVVLSDLRTALDGTR